MPQTKRSQNRMGPPLGYSNLLRTPKTATEISLNETVNGNASNRQYNLPKRVGVQIVRIEVQYLHIITLLCPRSPRQRTVRLLNITALELQLTNK